MRKFFTLLTGIVWICFFNVNAQKLSTFETDNTDILDTWTWDAILNSDPAIVDNPKKDGVNKTLKCILFDQAAGDSWWYDNITFSNSEEQTITFSEAKRFLHYFAYASNVSPSWDNPRLCVVMDDGTEKRWRLNSKPSDEAWNDVVVDLTAPGEGENTGLLEGDIIKSVRIRPEFNYDGGNIATMYFFDEIELSSSDNPRGVPIYDMSDILNFEDIAKQDTIVESISVQSTASSYEIVDNPFTESELNSTGKVFKYTKGSEGVSWWQGAIFNFNGIIPVVYGGNQYVHVLFNCPEFPADLKDAGEPLRVQLQIIDKFGNDVNTGLSAYELDVEKEGEWVDLVWDASDLSSIKSFGIRADVRQDLSGEWIDNTSSNIYYIDNIVINDSEDPRLTEDIKVTGINITSEGDATTITQAGGTLQLASVVTPGNATYPAVIWSIISGSEYATVSASGLVTAVADGIVVVQALATDGSGVTAEFTITISGQSTGISDIRTSAFSLYPNPAVNKIQIKDASEISAVSITNIIGQLVFSQNNNNGDDIINLNIEALKRGVYFVTIKNQRGKISGTCKLIKK